MSCEEIKNLIDEYITGELGEEQCSEVEKHLGTCEDCRRELAELKAFKGELSALAEDVPTDFEDGLRAKIKKRKRVAFINRFGASAAAAVALVCIIGIGYGYGNNEHLESKISEVRENRTVITERATTKISDDIATENDAAAQTVTHAEEEKTTENVTKAEIQREETTAEVGEKITYKEENKVELQPETETEAIKVQASTDTQAEETTAPAKETASVKAAADINWFSFDDEEAADADMDMDMDMDMTDSAPMVKSAAAAPESTESFDVNIIINKADVDRLTKLLDNADGVEYTESNDGIVAYVSGLSYGELKKMISDIEITEESIYIEESVEYYSVKFKIS